MTLYLLRAYFIHPGVVTYWGRDTQSSKQSDLSEPSVDSSRAPEGVYIMRTTSQLCCETTDTKGTHFTVMSNGQMTIQNTQTEPVANATDSTCEEAGSETKVNSEPSLIQTSPVSPLVPRFFVIHADGTGSELLRHVDVREFLDRAEEDPTTAVLKSPLEGHLDVLGLTVIKPYSGTMNCNELCRLTRAFHVQCFSQSIHST